MPTPLEPPDPTRCQTEIRTPTPFRMGGPPVTVTRCANKPVAIITETEPGKDGRRGSMTVCASCLKKATEQLGPTFFTVEQIA